MELLDLVDGDGQPVGKTVVRGTKINFENGEYAPVVHVYSRDGNGRFLIQKMSKEKASLYATTGGMMESGGGVFMKPRFANPRKKLG